MSEQIKITWERFRRDCQLLADRFRRSRMLDVYGIPTGGCFVAQQICQERDYFRQVEEPTKGCLVVDDLVDSGKTLERFAGYDETVILRDIPFNSICEHHLLNFTGTAAVAYVPNGGEVVGLSKLARLVLCYAKRPQVQERLAGQVVDGVMVHLKPLGAACIIKAEHSCLACRGAKLPGAQFVTSALRGVLKTDVSARAELMALIS